MRRLTPEEFFEKVSVWYDDETETMTLQRSGNMVWEVYGDTINYSQGDVLNFSDVSNNKKFYYNTGHYDGNLSVEDNIAMAVRETEENMRRLAEWSKKMEHECVDVKCSP